MAWKLLLSAKLPAISRPIITSFTVTVQVGASKTKGLIISLQAAVYPGALAAGTLHTTTRLFMFRFCFWIFIDDADRSIPILIQPYIFVARVNVE